MLGHVGGTFRTRTAKPLAAAGHVGACWGLFGRSGGFGPFAQEAQAEVTKRRHAERKSLKLQSELESVRRH